ncbi:MAG: tetratricopeptide repeat protein [Planctomycetota bacterium]|jgi:tetratricopeptide (TPR) repeat protein
MADVSKLFEKAGEAVKRRSYDMAVDLYQQILVIDPDSEKARLSLREAELKKVNEFGPPSKVFSALASIPSLFRGAIYRWAKKPDLSAIEYERILALDPRNAPISVSLAKALEAAGHTKSALAVYRGVTLWDPDNLNALLSAGSTARRLGRVEEALEYYKTANQLNPKEKTASDAVRDLSAMISLKPREEAASFRDLIKTPGVKPKGKGEKDREVDEGGPEGETAALQARFDANPKDKETATALARLYERERNFKGLTAVVNQAVKALPEDPDIRLLFRESNVTIWEEKLRRLEAKRKEGQSISEEECETLQGKLRASRITLMKVQLEREPTRQDIRFDLGLLEFESGQIDDAVAHFQQVKKDPKKKLDAAFWLGRGFLEKGKFNLAVNQLESALPSGGILDARGKEVLYFLGKAKQSSGDPEGARKHFERIYEEDITFRDVAEILEELA